MVLIQDKNIINVTCNTFLSPDWTKWEQMFYEEDLTILTVIMSEL